MSAADASPSASLAQLAEAYLTALFEAHPTMAAGLGLHEYDGRMPDPGEPARARRTAGLRDLRARLGAIPRAVLDLDDAHDHTLLAHAIDEELFELEQLREFERNPLAFSGPLDVSGYIKRGYAPVERRVRALTEHLRQVPRYLAAARETLCRPVPRPFLDTALEVYGGTAQFQETDLRQAVRAVPNVALRDQFDQANDGAIAALRLFMRHLEEVARPRASEEFQLGEERFLTMLRLGEMVDLPIARLLEIGEADLARNQARLRDACNRLAPGRAVRDVLMDQAQHHPPADRLLADAEAVLEDLRAFVEARGLVSIPAAGRCRVEATPPFARWTFAMMDTAGPFETAAESFYYVTLPDPGWTPEQTEEWLRKFDYATLRDVGIHEVYPGHYAHFLHVRAVPRKLRRVLTSYSFVEGWAHYCEEMMLDAGYGAGDPHLRLAQLSEALLRNVRFLVSIQMHTRGLSNEAAARMFVEAAHMDPLPADREAVRGTFDPGYLNYTLGKLMVTKLRADLERDLGGGFSLREFHDGLMALGAPPLPLARRRFLPNDPSPL
jgi:uncharacterized protein (DUF885 family)